LVGVAAPPNCPCADDRHGAGCGYPLMW
jgi:hypothetical protein